MNETRVRIIADIPSIPEYDSGGYYTEPNPNYHLYNAMTLVAIVITSVIIAVIIIRKLNKK